LNETVALVVATLRAP